MSKVKEISNTIRTVLSEISPKNRLYILLFALLNILLIVSWWLYVYFISIQEAKQAEEYAEANGIPVNYVPQNKNDSSKIDSMASSATSSDSVGDASPKSSSEIINEAQYKSIQNEDLDAHRELIQLFSDRELYRKSLKHIERISHHLADDVVFQAQAGQAYSRAGKPKQAIPYLQKALEKNPGDIDLTIQLAQAEFADNKTTKAIKSLQDLNSKYPDNKKVRMTLVASLSELDPNSQDVLDGFIQLKKEYPNDPMVWYQSARHKMNQGNFASSESELRKALDLDPLDQRVHARMGMALYYLRNYKGAEIHYKTALSMNPEDYNTWYNLGELKYTLANRTWQSDSLKLYSREALRNFLQALSLERNHPKAHYRVGLLLNSNQQFKEAIDHFKKSLESHPSHVESLIGIAIAYEATGHKEEATESLERAYYLDPFNRVLADKLSKIKT